MSSVPKLLYNRREAASCLSLSVRAVDYLIADGRLASRRIGGRVLISLKTLTAFADQDHTEGLAPVRAKKPLPAKQKRPVSLL